MAKATSIANVLEDNFFGPVSIFTIENSFFSVRGDVADQREAEDDVAGRLDHLALQPRVRGRRYLPQPLRDASGNASAFHPGRLHRQRDRTQRMVSDVIVNIWISEYVSNSPPI